MRRLLLTLGLLFITGPCWSAAALVQSRICAAATCQYSSNTTVGNTLVVLLVANDTGTTGWAPTSSGSESFTTAVLVAWGSTAREGQVSYSCNAAGGTQETITKNANTAESYVFWVIAEVSGLPTSGCLDTTSSGVAGQLDTGSFSIISGDIVLGINIASSTAPGIGSGFTTLGTGDGFSLAEYQVVAATSIDVVFTGTAAADTRTIAAAFKVPGGASGGGGFGGKGGIGGKGGVGD